MKKYKWYLFFAVVVIIISIVYPYALLFPIWFFGLTFGRAFFPYGFIIQPPEYLVRLVGLLIGLICIAISLYLRRREMRTQAMIRDLFRLKVVKLEVWHSLVQLAHMRALSLL